MKVIPRGRGSANAVPLAALLGLVVLLVLGAYYPFAWDPPRVVDNEVTRSGDGSLLFGDMNRARTPGTPSWLDDARSSGSLQIELDVDPSSAQQDASILMLARDFWHTDIAIGQDHSDLLVWLRRPGSDQNGNPAYTVAGALRAGRWSSVDVTVHRDAVRIDVNGTRRLAERLPTGALSGWGPGQVALGDEVHGGGPWEGRIRQAEVRTPEHAVEYTRPGALSIPAHYLYFPDHVAPFPPLGRGEWAALVFHLLSFIPIGFLIVWSRRPPVRLVPATLLALALAVVLAAGKFLFHGRHTEATDIVVQTAGAWFGAWLAWRWARRRGRPETAPSPEPDLDQRSSLPG